MREHTSRGGTEREGDTETKTGSRLWGVSTEPNAGIELTNCEIITWAEVRRLNNWAIHAPQFSLLFKKRNSILPPWPIQYLLRWLQISSRCKSSGANVFLYNSQNGCSWSNFSRKHTPYWKAPTILNNEIVTQIIAILLWPLIYFTSAWILDTVLEPNLNLIISCWGWPSM